MVWIALSAAHNNINSNVRDISKIIHIRSTMADDDTKNKKVDDVIEDTDDANASADPVVVDLQKKLDEMTSAYKRALADYQNLVKRTEAEKKDFVQFAVKMFLEKLLSVVDDLGAAQAHLKDKGLELTLKKLEDLLKNEGLTRIETIGKDYDINTMEALQLVPGKDDNKVVSEHRAGYMMHGSVLRPAQVSVSKKK